MENAAIDPIFAAIEAHNQARQAHLAATRRNDADAIRKACDADTDATTAMLSTTPQTAAGMRALLKVVSQVYMIQDLACGPDMPAFLQALSRSPALAAPVEDKEAIAAFNTLYYNWWGAECACRDPSYDTSEETTTRLCDALYAAEAALRDAPTPTKGQLKHKFHYLDVSIEQMNDGDIEAAVASIKEDLRRFGFDLPRSRIDETWTPRRSSGGR